MYEYTATVVRVVDGDTVDVDISLGFGVSCRQLLRLVGIDAPERRGDEKVAGLAATAFLESLLAAQASLSCRTLKDRTGKYGRYLAVLLGLDADGNVCDLNQMMIAGGHAVPYSP